MKRIAFPGFPPEGLAFLRALQRNNRREWFRPRKHIYEERLWAPMGALVTALNAELAKFAPDYINDPEKAIYRVYRDTRFSHDKTPYKTHIAALFPRRGMQRHVGAGLYFQVSPEGVEVAGGVYLPPPENLLAIRRHLLDHHAEYRRIVSVPAVRRLAGDIVGERLARVPKGFPADHPAAELVRHKQWYFDVTLEAGLAETPRLLPELAKRFRAMIPLVEFFNRPLLKKGGQIRLTPL
ncbi:MAG: DUF2461 domain-containing protein [Acidobacteria bacterium]|nr:DUF2461 domain-containing protein [Acidobacteriota bacterium]